MRWLKFASVSIVLCVACDDDPVAQDEQSAPFVRFTVLASSNSAIPIEEAGLLVIDSLEEAEEFSQTYPNTFGAERILSVNYATSFVLVLSAGTRPNNQFYLSTNRVTLSATRLTVHGLLSGSTSGSTVVSYPVQILRIPRVDLPVALELQYECDDEVADPNAPCFVP